MPARALLPPSSTPFEIALSEALDRLDAMQPGVAELRGFKHSPLPDMLPFLIREYGLEDVALYVDDLAEVIREGLAFQRTRGTNAAIHRALHWINRDGAIEENPPQRVKWWWFQLHLPGLVRSSDFVDDAIGVVTAAKPLRSEFARITAGYDIRGFMLNGSRLNGGGMLNSWSGVRRRPGEPVLSFRHTRSSVVEGGPIIDAHVIEAMRLSHNTRVNAAAPTEQRSGFPSLSGSVIDMSAANSVPFDNAHFSATEIFGRPSPRIQSTPPEFVQAPQDGLFLTFDYTPSRDGLALRTGGPTQAGYWAGEGVWTPRYREQANPKGYSHEARGQYQWSADPAYDWSNDFNPFAIVGGRLRIRAQRTEDLGFAPGEIPDRPGTGAPYPYVSGTLAARHSFSQQGGYWEARVRVPGGAATWSQIRLLPADASWPPELGPIVHSGVDNTVYRTDYYLPNPTSSINIDYSAGIDISAGFHTYAVDWTHDRIRYLLDGVVVRTIDVSNTPAVQRPLYPMLELAIGSNMPAFVPAPNETTPDTIDMLVEYVRVWQRRGPNAISLSALSVLDSHVAGDVVATISASVYGDDTALTFEKLADPDNKFNVVGNQLRLASTIAAETDTSHTVGLRVTDSAGREWRQSFVITVVEATPSGTNLIPTNLGDWVILTGTIADLGLADQRFLEQALDTGIHRVHYPSVEVAGTRRFRLSVDVRGGLGRDWFVLMGQRSDYAARAYANFNVATGTVGDAQGLGWTLLSSTMIPLGGGIYRCGIEFETDASTTAMMINADIATAENTSSYAGVAGNGLHITNPWLADITP